MQKIILQNKNMKIFPIFKNVLDLYELYSDLDNIDYNLNSINIEKNLKELVKIIEIGENKKHNIKYIDTNIQKLNKIENKKNIIVCFSGGKDSVATAIKYKNDGYNVFLYHVQGINGVYTDEWIRAKDIAEYLNLPLYIEKIKLDGKNTYLEHCMKNQVICSLALNYAINNNIGTIIAYGDFITDKISEGLFDRNWSDTQEMWDKYCEYIHKYIPSFELLIPNTTYIETLDVVSEDMILMNKIQGCLSPQRFRNKLHDLNENKYKVKLLKNRCGSCWKCCVEYIFLVDSNKIEYNKDMYKHCVDILKKIAKTEKPWIKNKKDMKELYLSWLPNEKLYNQSKLKQLGE